MKKSLLLPLFQLPLCRLAHIDVEQRGNSPNDCTMSLDCTPLSIATADINHSSINSIQMPTSATFLDVGLRVCFISS